MEQLKFSPHRVELQVEMRCHSVCSALLAVIVNNNKKSSGERLLCLLISTDDEYLLHLITTSVLVTVSYYSLHGYLLKQSFEIKKNLVNPS